MPGPQIALGLLMTLQGLVLSLWAGGLIYSSYVAPLRMDGPFLPPIFLRVVMLARFGRLSTRAVILLAALEGGRLVLAGSVSVAGLARLLLLAGAIVSSVQLQGFVKRAMAVPQDDDGRWAAPGEEKLLRQVDRVLGALTAFALLLLALQPW